MALSLSEISAALAHDYSFRVSGRSGSIMAEQLPTIESLESSRQQRPDDWIIELGTNDGGSYQNVSWATDFQTEVAAVRSARCVIFVTLSPLLARAGPIGPRINEAITRAVASHPNFHILDWGHIEYLDRRWTSPVDGIHPTPEGSTELASLEAQALRDFG
jgi:lysophospholipase L1-like esterase